MVVTWEHMRGVEKMKEEHKRFKEALEKIEAFGHSHGHGHGYTCANIAEKALNGNS